MSDVFADNRSLQSDPLIILFNWDFTTGLLYPQLPGGPPNFTFTNNNGGTLSFGGVTYHSIGCNYQNDTVTLNGKIPRASLDIDLQHPLFRPIINHYQLNIKGMKLNVIYTRKKYLSEPNPVLNQHYEQETWSCYSYTSIKKGYATVGLTVGLGLEDPIGVGSIINNNVS